MASSAHWLQRRNFSLIAPNDWILAFVFLLAEPFSALAADEPKLTPEQQAKLDVAEKLNRQIVQLYGQGKYADAAKLGEQALAIKKEVLGEKHPSYAASLNNLAALYDSVGDYAKAEPLYRQAIAITKEVLGEKHPHYADSLNNLAALYLSLGDYAKAEPLYRQALSLRKEVLGEKHPSYAASLNNLAGLYQSMGDYGRAEPLFLQALVIRRAALGEKNPSYAASLNNLAALYQIKGDYAEAEPLMRQALAINKEVLGEKHPNYAASLDNLAGIYQSLGDYGKAEPLFRQALSVRKEVLGEKHPEYATSLNNLAALYQRMGDYAKAEPLYWQALAIDKEVVGEKHPNYAASLNSLAALYYRMGDYVKAEPLYRQAIEITKAALGEKHPEYANCLNNLAALYGKTGDYAKAEPLYRQALAIRKAVLGEKHPEYANSLENLAGFYAVAKNWQPAAQNTEQARRVIRRYVARVLPSLSAKEQATFLQVTDEGQFHGALSLGLLQRQDPSIAALSAGWLANGKGVTQEALAQRALLARESDNPQVGATVKQLEEIRRHLASLTYAAPKPAQEAARREQLDKLAAQEDDLGRRLASATGQNYQADPWVEAASICQAVPVDAVMLDIVRFRLFNFQAKAAEKRWQPAHYVAWLVPPAGKGDIQIIDLGEAEQIDHAVQAVRNALDRSVGEMSAAADQKKPFDRSADEQLMQKPLAELSQLVLAPLLKQLPQDTRQLIVSPDAALWLVPWGALPIEDGQYAIEKYQIRYLVSGRDLVAARASSKLNATQPVVKANPDYDLGPSQVATATRNVLRGTAIASNELRSLSGGKSASALPKVGRLPGTAVEAAAIKPKLGIFAHAEPITYLDQYATEGVFKALKRPQVLVMSTHGFFLPDQEVKHDERGGMMASSDQRSAPLLTVDGKPVENPLLRCGLLLAGCNRGAETPSPQPSPQGRGSAAPSPQPSPGGRGSNAVSPAGGEGDTVDDGILTGMEIVGTDLRGTELVVLSACETGLGQVRNGEGVAGLRQAFQLAGAKSVVATLWQIPDKDSAQIMSTFFTNLAAGQAKADALRNAQLAQIELHRNRFGAAHPFFWAAFTITGE